MKLSEAIREGAKLRPQAFYVWISNGCSCALGAAYEAVKQKDYGCDSSELLQLFPELEEIISYETQNGYGTSALIGAVIQFNDVAKWTREQIADWLEEKGF